ncbi:XPG domain containing-domain-containing protein [Durotheca rogersii]|uniref:XPG domain containing-domain-containing protein n=1 Tax=Durotheca rogersii TaxID=419775 RepID=UPI0022201963|nr:XPG domain containing-domain-containing protein [Durotheca rogersii]KAI5866469.1 XPG domain containing-domain-containing protein [Durotheca rogersii]
MGIRGLLGPIRKHGVVGPLSGESVVVDGPALVHRIFESCMTQEFSSPRDSYPPPYCLLSRLVIGWLDDLEKYDVKVRKIYFDGYLPPAKWGVRLERLTQQYQVMKGLRNSHFEGLLRVPEHAFRDIKTGIGMTSLTMSSTTDKHPKPPFLIPSVLDALRNSQTWGRLVQVVPGEADTYCAQDIRESGGTLLTTDSDLLLQDLGLEGKVSLLHDVVLSDDDSESPRVMAPQFTLGEINKRLNLKRVGGLLRVAFEMKRLNTTFESALRSIRSDVKRARHSSKYESFVMGFQPKEDLGDNPLVLGMISSLDPRTSEIVIQTLLSKARGALSGVLTTETTEALRELDMLSIFLPVLVENHQKSSAWETSTEVRRIAYGVLRNFLYEKSDAIIEYRAKPSIPKTNTKKSSTSKMGRHINVPDLEEMAELCASLSDVLKKLTGAFGSLEIRWLAFAIYLDIQWSVSEERGSPSAVLTNEIINRPAEASEDAENYSWDLTHFTAQVQACLFSLRMGKQLLDMLPVPGRELPAPLKQLRDYLAPLPLIQEWPTAGRMTTLLSQFEEANGLATIAGILGLSSAELKEGSAVAAKPTGGQTRTMSFGDKKAAGIEVPGLCPSNPYDVLSHLSQ